MFAARSGSAGDALGHAVLTARSQGWKLKGVGAAIHRQTSQVTLIKTQTGGMLSLRGYNKRGLLKKQDFP